MTKNFDQLVAEMHQLLQRLQEAPLLSRDELYDIPQSGVFLLHEKGDPVYVGRSDHLKTFLLRSSMPSSTHNNAPFAFKLAKTEADRVDIDTSRTSNNLEKDAAFADLFTRAKKRVSLMSIRIVQVEDPIMQTLLLICAAVELKTPYNDFNTH